MSLFLKQFKPRQIFDAYRILAAAQARQSHSFPHYLPGPYPRTEEERRKAAKKYNLLPEEYEPYPEDENPVGDYPKLPFESVDAKDPYHPWDYPEIRKDFNEPLPREIMMLLPEALSTGPRQYTIKEGLFLYLSALAASCLLFWVLYQFEFVYPTLEKQYPTPGVTHYTFQPISDEELKKLKAQELLKECLEKCKSIEV